MTDFSDMYRPTEDHAMFRAAIREIAEEKIAPAAAEVDEQGEFPARPGKRCGPGTSTHRTSRRNTRASAPTPSPR